MPDAELLARLIAAHPQSAHDSVADTHAAWKRLSREDRREAVLRFAEWIGAKGARKAIAGLPIYLGEKRWQLLPARAADGSAAKTRLDAFGQPWWWLFHSGVAAQPEAFADPDSSASQALKKQVDLAAMYAIGWTIDPAKHAEIEAKSKVLVKLHKGDPLAEAWRAHYRALGVPMPIPDRADWIFVPAELPQPQEAASAGGASRTGGEDYAAVAEGLAR